MKTVANREVRDAIKHSGAYQYEIAYAIGISEATLCVWLRNCPASASSAFWQLSKSCPQPVKGGGAWLRLSSARNKRERLHS